MDLAADLVRVIGRDRLLISGPGATDLRGRRYKALTVVVGCQ